MDVRIVAELRLGEISQTTEFVPQWIVQYNSFLRGSNRKDRLASIETDWYPQILPPGETRHIHLILEMKSKRWNRILAGAMKCRLEVLSSDSKEWKTYATYRDLTLDKRMFAYGDSYILTQA